MIIILLSTYKTGQLSQFESYIQALKPYFIPIATLIGILSGGINGLASSIFSREGKYLPELKIVPVKSQTVLTIKLLHVSTISFIGPLIGTIAIGVILNASVFEIILAFIISALTITFLNIIQFIIDAVRPMLEWDNPQKAMKQNLNVLFSILITFGYVAGMAATGYFTRDYIQPWLMSLLLFLVSLAGSYFMWKIAVYKTRKLLSGDM
jgi:ABC-2 type transport system permease protein